MKEVHFSIYQGIKGFNESRRVLYALHTLSLADTQRPSVQCVCVCFEPLTSQTDYCGFFFCCRIWCPCSTSTTMTTWGTSPRSMILAEKEGTSGWVPSSISRQPCPPHMSHRCVTPRLVWMTACNNLLKTLKLRKYSRGSLFPLNAWYKACSQPYTYVLITLFQK